MLPAQFVREVEGKGPQAAYLFLGPEQFQRDKCRRALITKQLRSEDMEHGFTRHDLSEISLARVLDDACSFSLFAAQRVIWVASAEEAAPKGRSTAGDDAGEGDARPDLLSRYVNNSPPGVVIVFDVSRYELEGEDKARVERVRKFYSAIPAVVEFARFSAEAARILAGQLARESRVQIAAPEIEMLVEACGADATRISREMEKLQLYGGEAPVTAATLEALVLNARTNSIFELVTCLGRCDRMRALDILDALVREGEYLPLALAFLGTQFRLALAAADAGLRGGGQIESHFRKLGVAIWRSRAEQVWQTVTAFPREKLERAVVAVHAADKALRDANPEDRIVLEKFILAVTG